MRVYVGGCVWVCVGACVCVCVANTWASCCGRGRPMHTCDMTHSYVRHVLFIRVT